MSVAVAPRRGRPLAGLSRRERAALAELIWRRLTFDSVGEEPEDEAGRAAWRLEGQTRATLNFLGVSRTLDEHAKDGEPAVQPFPLCAPCAKDEAANVSVVLHGDPPAALALCRAHLVRHKPYFREVVGYWHRQAAASLPALAEKSRQILLSWTFVDAHLWLAMTRPGSLIAFQSENLPKACELLNRAAVIYQTLPAELQRFGPMSDSPKAAARKIEDRIEFPEIRSRILAIPSGPNQVRMYTFTAIFMDEAQHWEPDQDFEDSYGAALATTKGGGRLTAISSVGHPDRYHYRLCRGMVA